MRENSENIYRETAAAFALAILLLNFLVLFIVVGLVWLLQLLISPKSPLIVALGETIWR
jgi:hypothetical protein